MKPNTNCKVCNKEVSYTFLGIHVWNVHRIKAKDYGIKYLGISPTPTLCKCGCGQPTTLGGLDVGWKPYVHGHNKARLGVKNSEEAKNKISETLKLKYATGEIVNPHKGKTKETCAYIQRISDKLKGSVITESAREKISESLKKKYKDGTIKAWNTGLTKADRPSVLSTSKKLMGSHITQMVKYRLSVVVTELHHTTDIYGKEWRKKISTKAKERGKEGILWAQSEEGRKRMSEVMKEKNDSGKMRIANSVRPNKVENKVKEWFPELLTYTGNGKFWVTFNGVHKNPDFVVSNNNKKIIEVFGIYYHKILKDDYNEVMEGYKSIGYECLIVWDTDIIKRPEEVKKVIADFINKKENNNDIC